ncbi:helix-turn-helix transcriptional regulator [Actinoplanes auranticolor]|uniref:Transcriptional regulator n=1 Tax=Actinoplanes auranticolor TaxID=47988 RepID=A0A919S4Z6_9ACTN|nr:helix-turn-helix transcriptional regulator [Actinoplanes auranticolor]GIM65141.1 transcriptional regulator [Actinoplanes auranticolor]
MAQTDSSHPLRNRIKLERARHDLTQERLADLVGVTRKTINTVETARFVPSTVLALKLAKALHTTVDELFYLTDEQ